MEYQIGDLVDVFNTVPECIGRGRILSIAGRVGGITIEGCGQGWRADDLSLVDGPLAPAPDRRDQYPNRGTAEDRARAVGRYAAAYMASLEWATVVRLAMSPEPEYRAMYTAERRRRELIVRTRNLAARPVEPDDGARARVFLRAAGGES